VSDSAATPTRFLIREHYRRIGAYDWNKPRFIRLCAKLNETEAELAERIGISAPSVLARRLKAGFTPAEGILLSLLDTGIDTLKRGAK
jgi:hypothetical protein